MELVNLLLASGCAIDAKNIINYTPLHYAVVKENVELARLLLDSGCAMDVKDRAGDTPLQHAILQEHRELRKLLSSTPHAKPSSRARCCMS